MGVELTPRFLFFAKRGAPPPTALTLPQVRHSTLALPLGVGEPARVLADPHLGQGGYWPRVRPVCLDNGFLLMLCNLIAVGVIAVGAGHDSVCQMR